MKHEAWLAYFHIGSILLLTTFLAARAALCRSEWLNAAVIRRLARVDAYYGLAALSVLASGLARSVWGIKGSGWYWTQWLLHTKLGLFVLIGALSVIPTLRFRQWLKKLRRDEMWLPPVNEVQSTRRLIMIEAHLLIIMPLLGVFLAR